MNAERTFDAVFWTLFVLMFVMRFWFGFRVWRTWRTGERLRADHAAHPRESLGLRVIEQVFWLLVVVVVVLWFRGDSLRNLAFPSPHWLRWAGIGLGVTSVALFAWTHMVLGWFWSPSCVQLRPGHQLITAGPYARIRHPMYSAILGWLISLGLVAANGTPFVFAALGIVNVLLRIREEEEMMLRQFGDEYREYMKRTGRLLPVL